MSSEDSITIRQPVYETLELTDEDLEKSVQIDKEFYMAAYHLGRSLTPRIPQTKQLPIVHTRSDGSVFDGTLEVILVDHYRDRRIASTLRMYQIMFGRVPGAQLYYDLKPHCKGGYRSLTDFEDESRFMNDTPFEGLIQAVNYHPDRARRYIDEFNHFKSAGGFKKASSTLDDEEELRKAKESLQNVYDIVFCVRQNVHTKFPNIAEEVANFAYDIARKIKLISSHDLTRDDTEIHLGKRIRSNSVMAIGFCGLPSFTTQQPLSSGVTALADSLDDCSIETNLDVVENQSAACSLDEKSPNLTDD